MKKIIVSLLVSAMFFPMTVGAVVKKATLINEQGVKIVVNVGDKVPFGFKLFTNNIGGSTGANPSFYRDVIGAEGNYTNIGTGTSAILTTGFDYDVLSMYLELKPGTSTSQTVSITPYYSLSGCTASSDWFGDASFTTSGLISTTTAPMVYNFNTSTTTDQYYRFNIYNQGAKCVKFGVTSTYATSTMLMSALVKNN